MEGEPTHDPPPEPFAPPPPGMTHSGTIGLCVRPAGLEWTALAPSGGVQQRKAAARSEAAPATAANWAESFPAQLALEAPLLKGNVHLCIPADGLLLRVLDLPTVDASEIGGMVELQIDQFSPFPVDLLYLSWETLSQTDSRSRVLVAGARRNLVDRLGVAADTHKLAIRRIDADILAWLALFRKAGKLPSTGRSLLLLEDGFCPLLVCLENGQPLFFRALPLPAPGAADRETVLLEEIDLALAEIEADWGAAPLALLQLAHWGQEPSYAGLLHRHYGVQVQGENLASLDPLSDGVAMRFQAALDLSPRAWKDIAAAKALRSRTLKLAAVAVVLWAVGWGVFLGLLAHRQGEVDALRAEVEGLAKPAEEVRQLEKELVFLNAFTNRTETALDCMLTVVNAMPPSGVQLGDFLFKKSIGVAVHGQGPSTTVLGFTKAMGESPMFKLDDLQVENGKFSFNAKLASAPPPEKPERGGAR